MCRCLRCACICVTKMLPPKGLPVCHGQWGVCTGCPIILLHHFIRPCMLSVQQPQKLLCPVTHEAALGAPCNTLQLPLECCPEVACLSRPNCMHVCALCGFALLIKPHLMLDIPGPPTQGAAPGCRQPTVKCCTVDHAHEHSTSGIYAQLRAGVLHAFAHQSCTQLCRPLLI